jgi:2'-5' RNA ligase
MVTHPKETANQRDAVTAIDVVLEPDDTMLARARAANARLLEVFAEGFPLDAGHAPHITMLIQYVRTADLDAVGAAVETVFENEHPAVWTLTAFGLYYDRSVPPLGVAGIVIEPTEDLHRLQRRLIEATAPYTESTGNLAAFASAEEGRDIQEVLVDGVANYVRDGSAAKFNPHVTIGVATQSYLDDMLAEPFDTFTFSPGGAAIYQVGTFGTAAKQLNDIQFNR